MVIAGLCRLSNGVCNWLQLVVQRRRFDNFSFGPQFAKDLLTHLNFLVLSLALLIVHLLIRRSILCWLTLRLLGLSLLFLLLSRCLVWRTADDCQTERRIRVQEQASNSFEGRHNVFR